MSDMATENFANLAPSNAQKFRMRVLPFVLFAAVAVLIPLFGPSRSAYSLLNAIGINIVFALSYNMLLGRAGLLSFGHAVYFGLGGYAALHAMGMIENADGGFWGSVPVFAMPLVGFAGGALAGAVIGWPSCRRAGTAFAMISLGVAELIAAMGFMFGSIFGGEEGISGDRMNGPEVFGLSLGPIGEVYWFIAFWTVLAALLIFAFTRTPLGRMSEATRDNPQRVEFVGYDPTRVRYLVFIAAGGFAGLAGGMSAVNYEIFTPEALSLLPSGFVLIMTYVGGARYFAGPVLGAIVLTYMQSNLSDFTEAWLLYLGLLFITIVMYAPNGLAGIVAGLWNGTRATGMAYLKTWAARVVAIAIAMVGVIVLVEVAVRKSNGYGEVFEPFGLHLTPGSPLTWALVIVPLIVGLGLLRHLARDEQEAGA
ncbi:branched-chain amino acid ABC transporter permease [Actibacterium lipolyticum]|uniref:Leucine/isoleucine/valine transporter permease subunit n=1 Tax=Actibacterium lipolyticum TaxID=1524263 RepID=A0A238KN86_9RHOB|nr:branched-chain amino acid ABC transporter permease [Actibacterium lipolyticum]SMX44273.1 leucine/isoleucine/valine transporter permease subunit [Actibacterium lipolyticum]